MLSAVWNILSELSPWLLLGAVVAGLMHILIPSGGLKKLLRGRGGVVASVLMGIPLPLCSCSVIPVGIGLRQQGASSGAAIGFLISTPQTGIDSILVSGSMLGWPFAIFKVFAALIMGVIGGGLTQLFGSDSRMEPTTEAFEAAGGTIQPLAKRCLGAALHSVELLRSIWRWLVVGIVVSAAISWLVPPDQLTALVGVSGVMPVMATLLISLPLYVCATASVPIAAALVSSGLPAGAAMVFLVAGPATNLATLGSVYRSFGPRATGLYLLTMIGGSIAAGLLFDVVLPVHAVQDFTQHDHRNGLSVLCSVVVAGMIAWFAVDDLRRFFQSVPASTDQAYRITGMTCDNCAIGLERALREISGVHDATVRYATKEARISGNPAIRDILQVISSHGFVAAHTLGGGSATKKSVSLAEGKVSLGEGEPIALSLPNEDSV